MATVVALGIPTTTALAATEPYDPLSRFESTGGTGAVDESLLAGAVDPSERVSVIIEMSEAPVAVVEAEAGRDLTDTEQTQVRDRLEDDQAPVLEAITATGGDVHAEMQSAYNGLQATVSAADVAKLATLPGVVAIHRADTFELDNATSVPTIGVPEVWQSTGYTGRTIKMAIIDSGIDYTHATFGGPGTVAAFQQARSASTESADPALFGQSAPRVKGGIDLVGDSYNAGDEDEKLRVPHPDDNPLDCGGHGTHVAGTAGGGGVLADGSSYSGPYDSTTASRPFRVGPGVAPEVDLYAVRVFSCYGSTDMVTSAIDWAVANDMDVINLSLGSPFGRADDPTAVAASNAVAAGVTVVAANGNTNTAGRISGNPYVMHSPATGNGVIGVAAIDARASFPGATVAIYGEAIRAININGADLTSLGKLTVTRLRDDPRTTADESLGCTPAAYTFNGVTAGAKTLAVVTSGYCREGVSAVAIAAQRAGAAAVLEVSTNDMLPLYQGAVTADPGTDREMNVTIASLGVVSSDGEHFQGGRTATFTAATLDNPDSGEYADFTASGPRSGSSRIGPDVSAPGVSVASAAIGTGNGRVLRSGTSMATPHVAGVAALVIHAHPRWNAAQVSAAIITTADPEKIVAPNADRGGVGLIDPAQAVATRVIVQGDTFRTDRGWRREPSASFGFQQSTRTVGGEKSIAVQNVGRSPVTYDISIAPAESSLEAQITTNRTSVTVAPGKTATITLSVSALAESIPGIAAGDAFSFHEIAGNVVFTAPDSTLRVPYLLVPRSNSAVTAPTRLTSGNASTAGAGARKLTVRNLRGAIDANADVYTWGLADPKDVPVTTSARGNDLRAVGVQSFAMDGDTLLVFAVNVHDRWANAAEHDFEISIDRERDGSVEWIVGSYDSGLGGGANGRAEVFAWEPSEPRGYHRTGFHPSAPTDSSTILLPVWASQIGVDGTFDYTARVVSSAGDVDSADGWATYDPTAPALSNGHYVPVPRGEKATIEFTVDAAAARVQRPLGAMIVVMDNATGSRQARLVKVR